MPLAQLAVHAAVSAFADACGLSGAAHAMALGLWLPPPEPPMIAGVVGLGTGIGAVVAARARLFPALSEGARALSRPSSFLSSSRAREALVLVWIPAVSAAVSLLFRSLRAAPPETPATLAAGLGATGIALLLAAGSVALRGEPPSGRSVASGAAVAPRDLPSLTGATLAGVAHALGVWPGVSRVGLAVAALIGLGVRPVRALPFALVATVPFWWARFVTALPDAGAVGFGRALLAALFAFLGAVVASSGLRALAQRRALIALPLWMIPLACAIFAYSRAA